MPRDRATAFAEQLTEQLRDRTVLLGAVVVFGGGFLFWCVDGEASQRPILQSAHEDAITLAEGFLDPVANTAVVEATRRLTGDDAVLVEHARRCGYAFIEDRYLPHITLGFDPRLVTSELGGRGTPRQAHTMRVERVVPIALGPYGRVERLLWA